jgi:hypothetical protein
MFQVLEALQLMTANVISIEEVRELLGINARLEEIKEDK